MNKRFFSLALGLLVAAPLAAGAADSPMNSTTGIQPGGNQIIGQSTDMGPRGTLQQNRTEARNDVIEARNDARRDVMEARDDARNNVQNARNEAREDLMDARRDARQDMQNARENIGEARQEARQDLRDARQTEQEKIREAREEYGEAKRDAGRDYREARRDVQEDGQSVGEYLDDAGITAKVKAKFVGQSGLDALDIHVTTINGVVTLEGDTKEANQVDLAERVAREVDGVRQVQNNLHFVPNN